MNEKVQELEVEVQNEAGLTDKAAGNTEEAEAKTTRETVQEVKREAKEAKIAALNARKEAKEAKRAALKDKKEAQLAAKKAKKAKKTEAKATSRDEIIVGQERKRRATLNQGAEQVEAELAKGVELASVERTEKEVREVELVTEGAAKAREVKEISTQFYKGTINLVLMPPAGVLQIKNLGEKLRLIQNLRVILIGGSVDEPTRVVVSAEQPIPLIDVLSQIPIVDQVTKKGKEIQILLKAAALPRLF